MLNSSITAFKKARNLAKSIKTDQDLDWGIYSSLKLILQRIMEDLNERKVPGYGNLNTKLSEASGHLDALYGVDEANGHDLDQHKSWLNGCLMGIASQFSDEGS